MAAYHLFLGYTFYPSLHLVKFLYALLNRLYLLPSTRSIPRC